MDARLIVTPAATGAWNMAVDEALLEQASRGGVTTLRFYAWSEPTLSLGYFQRFESRRDHAPSCELACVRRASGGGAIVHHHELTYSFATPLKDRFSDRSRYVELFHQAAIDAVSDSGVDARLAGTEHLGEEAGEFLCFRRRTALDVVAGFHKILGSAQRHRHGALLQHGSLLLSESPHAPGLLGLQQLDETGATIGPLLDAWSANVAKALTLKFASSTLKEEERQSAQVWQQERFANADWTRKR